MGKFKVGDTVRCVSKETVSENISHGYVAGKEFIVDEIREFISDHGSIYIYFPENGHGVYEYDLELVEEKVKTLPKSFACENTNDKLWEKYIKWLNKEYRRDFVGDSYNWPYYGIMSSGEFDHNKSSYFDTIISLEEWDEIVNGKQTQIEEVMKTNEITKDQLKQIHDVACSGWKAKIIEFAARNPFGNTVEFTSEEVAEMFKASDNKQTEVLEGIFGLQRKELDFRSDTINFSQDGIKIFGNSECAERDAFIGLPAGKSVNNMFFLNENYKWELRYHTLICTRK
jgi:hypothetical protein